MSWKEYKKEPDYQIEIKRRWRASMVIPTIAVVAIFSTLAYILIGEATGAITYSCTKEFTVVDILSVNYRSATILTEDNEEIVLTQERFTVGDKICVKSKRKTDWTNI